MELENLLINAAITMHSAEARKVCGVWVGHGKYAHATGCWLVPGHARASALTQIDSLLHKL